MYLIVNRNLMYDISLQNVNNYIDNYLNYIINIHSPFHTFDTS